jgi:signal transduction histidine kinase
VIEFLHKLFSPDFMPHGYCMRWNSDVVWLHVISDAIITLAYYIIPFGLIYFVKRRKDLAFDWIFVAFGIFILACGATHMMAIITLWDPVYRIDGVIKAMTAIASIVTAALLVRLLPALLKIPSPAQLRAEIALRTAAEQDLRQLNRELERRVEQRTEKLNRYNQALQRVAYISGHDLREPVRTVTTFTEMLESRSRDRLSVHDAEYIAYIMEGSRRIQQMVDDLLEYTRAVNSVTGERSDELSPVDLGAALSAAIGNVRAAIENSGVQISSDGQLPVVCGRHVQLQQVFQNLLSNAIKYRSRTGLAQIHVSAVQNDGMHTITVRDNGIGLNMTYAAIIFEAFKRLHGPEVPGSGVGLAICKNIIESFGGRIWVESDGPGKGAAFHFTLPAGAPETG